MKKLIVDSNLDELANAIIEHLLPKLTPLLHQQKDQDCKDVFTRKQVAELLSISYATLHNYIKLGILERVLIPGSGRVYFNRCAVHKLLNGDKKREVK